MILNRSQTDEATPKFIVLPLFLGYANQINSTIVISSLFAQKNGQSHRTLVLKNQALEETDILSFQMTINLSKKISFYKRFSYSFETIMKLEEDYLREAMLNLFLKENDAWEKWLKFEQTTESLVPLEEFSLKLKFIIQKLKIRKKIVGYCFEFDSSCDNNINLKKSSLYHEFIMMKKKASKIINKSGAFFGLHNLDRKLENIDSLPLGY
jgi:hypothetical protein